MEEISDSLMSELERSVVLLYDKTSDQVSVNDARKQLFTHKSRSLENIPPTEGSLVQHASYIKQTAWTEHCVQIHVFQVQWTGGGRKMMLDGSLYGPICQKLLSLAVNAFVVVVRKDVEGGASVWRQHWSVLFFVHVQELVKTDHVKHPPIFL